MARNRLDFVPDKDEGVKSLGHLVPMELFLAANIVDGEGKKTNRIVCRPKGTKQFYMLLPKGTEANMRTVTAWLQEILEQRVEQVGAPIPEPSLTPSTGSPMED